MNQEVEIELKNLLTKEEFQDLMNYFSIPETSFTTQTNYYFDTDADTLKKNGSALRIRKKQNTYTLTLKQPHGEDLMEFSDTLTEDEARHMIEGTKTPESEVLRHIEKTFEIQPSSLHCSGSLMTSRHERPYESGLLVLDHSKYLSVEDFEVEFEVPNRKQGEKEFKELLQKFQIPLRETPNKIKRFFDHKESLS